MGLSAGFGAAFPDTGVETMGGNGWGWEQVGGAGVTGNRMEGGDWLDTDGVNTRYAVEQSSSQRLSEEGALGPVARGLLLGIARGNQEVMLLPAAQVRGVSIKGSLPPSLLSDPASPPFHCHHPTLSLGCYEDKMRYSIVMMPCLISLLLHLPSANTFFR